MRIKSFVEYINEELRKVTSDVSGSGKTKSVDWIWDEPSSAKSPSSGVSLRDELRELEFQDLLNTMSDQKFDAKTKSQLRKEKFKRKSEKLSVTLNNLKFLKDMQKEKGDLYCEYCNKGPLTIYDITEEDLKNGPQKVGGRIRFNVRFNPKDGATCDHKEPQSKGGDKFDYNNLAVCCYSCNQKKKNMSWSQWSELLQGKKITEERMVDLSPFMEDLTGIDVETLEDQLLELTDKFGIMLRPGLFFVDTNGKLVTNKDGVVDYSSFPDVSLYTINGKTSIVPNNIEHFTNDYVWGWMMETWKKGETTYRENRICSKAAVEKLFSKINLSRLEKLGLDAAVVLSNSAGSEATDIYSIAIWSIK